jgi:hypothetical protein
LSGDGPRNHPLTARIRRRQTRQIDKAGNLHITISKMSDQRYELLIGMREAIEAHLAILAGVSPEAVDKFDKAYEAHRKRGDDCEPGDDPKAPHYRQH